MTDPISALASKAALVPPAGSGRLPSFALPAVSAGPPTATSLQGAVQAISRHFDAQQTQVRFRIDQDVHRLVVSVVDAQNGAVLIQIPSEDALDIARSIERTRAALVEQRA